MVSMGGNGLFAEGEDAGEGLMHFRVAFKEPRVVGTDDVAHGEAQNRLVTADGHDEEGHEFIAIDALGSGCYAGGDAVPEKTLAEGDVGDVFRGGGLGDGAVDGGLCGEGAEGVNGDDELTVGGEVGGVDGDKVVVGDGPGAGVEVEGAGGEDGRGELLHSSSVRNSRGGGGR